MAYCSNCGRRLYADDNFCSGCGRPVSQVSAGSLSSSSYTPAVTEGRRAATQVKQPSTPTYSSSTFTDNGIEVTPTNVRKGGVAVFATIFIIFVTIMVIMGIVGAFLENIF